MGRLMKCISFFSGPDFIHLFIYLYPPSFHKLYIAFYFAMHQSFMEKKWDINTKVKFTYFNHFLASFP